MKTKIEDLRKLSKEKLSERLEKLKMASVKYYVKVRGKTSPEKGIPSAKDIRKEIARIKTILRERKWLTNT